MRVFLEPIDCQGTKRGNVKKITAKFLKSIKQGSLVRVTWPDASADATDDGSPKVLLRDHDAIVYQTYGLFIGLAKGDLVLTSDKRVDKDEYRGKLNIPRKWIMDIEVIQDDTSDNISTKG